MLIGTSVAQSDDNSQNNVIGQEGNGNEVPQSDELSQNNNHNSMCVSGESVSLSCNDISSEQITGKNRDDESGILEDSPGIYQVSSGMFEIERGNCTQSPSPL